MLEIPGTYIAYKIYMYEVLWGETPQVYIKFCWKNMLHLYFPWLNCDTIPTDQKKKRLIF